MRMFIKVFFCIFIILSFQSCMLKINLPDDFNEINVKLITNENNDINYELDNEIQQRIFSTLSESSLISSYQVIKEALEEGEYIIEVVYKNESYLYTVINSINIYENTSGKFYKNKTLYGVLKQVLPEEI